MPIFNDLDFGPSNPWKTPKSGLHTAVVEIPGGYAIPYGVDATHPAWRLVFKYQARNAVGASAALSQNAMEYLGRQLEELSRNYDLQPVYVQLFAGTGLAGGAIGQPQDGWYYISNCQVDYTEPWTGVGTVSLDVEYVSPGPPRRTGMWFSGGSLTSTFSQPAVPWVGFPLNGVPYDTGFFTRTGGEGVIDLEQSPATNPVAFSPSATVGDWFKGGCRVYDAMAVIGTNPVPAAPTFANTNWVEVKGPDHRFTGAVVITNGYQLLTLSTGASSVAVCYLWNTTLGTPGWQQYGTLNYADVAGSIGALEHISLIRVGLEEVSLQCLSATSNGNTALLTLRLQRGAHCVRVDFRPLSQANSAQGPIQLLLTTNAKMFYNSGAGSDASFQTATAPRTDYGYAAAYTNNASYQFVCGLLYQNSPADNQPQQIAANNMGVGDSSGPAKNATRTYGVFGIPFVTPNLSAEAESGVLGTGWTSQAGAGGQSGGLEAKCASGTLTGNADTFGTAWSPPASVCDVYFRVKVTSAAGAASEMQLGLWNPTAASFVASTTYKANQVTTAYTMVRVATGVTLPAANNTQFRAVTTATLGTDWFIDEAFLAPTQANAYGLAGPQQLAQQFLYERQTKQVLG